MISGRKKDTEKTGSIALEAAIALPLVILLILFMIAAMQIMQTEVILASALDNTAAELSLLVPFTLELAEQGDLNRSIEPLVTEWLDKDTKYFTEIIAAASLDLASSVLFQNFIHSRNQYWLRQEILHRQTAFAMPLQSVIVLSWHIRDYHLVMTQTVQLPFLLKPMERQIRSVVPLWLGFQKDASAPADEESPDAVWLMDNFSRGRILRECHGANLPFNYPVIAGFVDGEAIAITSMDLTAPSYQTSGVPTGEIYKRLEECLRDLSAFQGHVSSSENYPTILPQQISARTMRLVIPANSPALFYSQVKPQLEALAHRHGIQLAIIQHGSSSRYITSGEDAS